MRDTLATLRLARRKDLLLVRQRARQLARLLGYDAPQQALIAAGTFAVAWQAYQDGRGWVMFRLEDDILHVFSGATPGARVEDAHHEAEAAGQPTPLRLVRALPKPGPSLSGADLVWAAAQLHEHTPHDWFEEVCRQNQEMLELWHRLQGMQAEGNEQAPGISAA